MRIGRSTNPTTGVFAKVQSDPYTMPMTLRGTVNKSILMFLLVFLGATFSWKYVAANPALSSAFMWISLIAGFITALIVSFKPEKAKIGAPIYAIAEGIFLGTISLFIDAIYPGVALQAVLLTFGVLGVMLLLYKFEVLRATPKFTKGLIIATMGIGAYYLLDIILSFFGIHIGTMAIGGGLGLGIQLVIVGIAAMSLIIDFDIIEKGVARQAPDYMEWYGAFSLTVTLVWLYLEILRLLAILANRD